MLRGVRAYVTIAASCSVALGCGLIAGITDFTFVDADAALPASEASAASDSNGAPGPNDAGPNDAGVVPTCGPSEICGDGIDNDCNGNTDCADLACATEGFACVAAPAGWTFVNFNETTRPPCPTGYGNPVDVQEHPDPSALPGDGTCTCTCGAPLSNGCVRGSFNAKFGGQNTCGGGTTNAISDGGCNPISVPVSNCTSGVCNAVTTSRVSGEPVACGATSTLPAAVFGAQGRSCEAIGIGCAAGAACLPKTDSAGTRCIAKAGPATCPGEYPTEYPNYRQGTATDGRTCSACTCSTGVPLCGSPVINFFADPTCAAPRIGSAAPSFGCSPLGGSIDASPAYFQYVAQPITSNCGVTNPSFVQGEFDAGDRLTICCP